MKHISKFLIPIVFIAVCIVCVGLKIQYNKLIKSRDYYKLVSESKGDPLNKIVAKKILSIYSYNRYRFPEGDSVFSFEKRRKISVSNIAEKGPLLILRLLETDCPPCVDSTLSFLAVQCKLLGNDQVAILTDKTIPRDVIIFGRVNNISYSIYQVHKGGLNISLENQTPYFFMLDKNGVMYDPFIIDPYQNNITISYLKLMTNKLLQQ